LARIDDRSEQEVVVDHSQDSWFRTVDSQKPRQPSRPTELSHTRESDPNPKPTHHGR
jgi:hypothetical protein